MDFFIIFRRSRVASCHTLRVKMKPSLWKDLIFDYCESPALLSLCATCKDLREQLNNAPEHVWRPLTMEDARMRHDERLLGWRGVEKAIARERKTRANCDAGSFTRGPVLAVLDARQVQHVLYVGGRIAVFSNTTVQLLDVKTGAQLALFEVERANCAVHMDAVLDRWVVFAAQDGRVLLLECAAELPTLVEMAPVDAARDDVEFSVAGSSVSFRAYPDTVVTIVRVWSNTEGTTLMQEVARLQLNNQDENFFLHERGCSFLLHSYMEGTLQLVDLATRQPKRDFTPRACLLDGVAALID